MRLKTITIQNFKCLGPEPISLDFSDNILVLIGENNVGKSSVLKALDIYFSGSKTISEQYFLNQHLDCEHAIQITIEFDELTEEEKGHQAISNYISNHGGINTWTLRKTYYYEEDGKSKCDYYAIVDGVEKKNPAGLSQNSDDLFTDEKMQKVYIEAIKNVTDVSSGNSKSIFSQLFNLILEDDIKNSSEFKELMNAFEKYAGIFQGDHRLPKVREVEEEISNRMSRIFDAKSIIEAQAPKADKVLPIPNLFTNDGREINTSPDEQGNGLQRVLIFSLLELLAEVKSPSNKKIGPRNIILIEEPEIYMHPQMIRKICKVLYNIAEGNKAQVIITTHSPFMIRIVESQKTLVRFVREIDNTLKTYQQNKEIFIDDPNELKQQLQMLIRFDPAVNELFFSKRVVLVEGDSEFVGFKEASELTGLFNENNLSKKQDTTLINCRGRDFIPLFQKVLNHFKIDYIVVHDTEGQDLNLGVNKKILDLLGNDEAKRKTFSPNFDDYLEIIAGGDCKMLEVAKKIRELGENNTLDSKLGDYIKFVYNLD